MSSHRPFKRINKSLENLKTQIAAAAPGLTRPELLDLADQIHEIIRAKHNADLWSAAAACPNLLRGIME